MSEHENKSERELILDIHRGMYGDKKNGAKGLIEQQKEDDRINDDHEKRIASIERDRNIAKKALVTITSGGGIAGMLIGFKESIVKIFE